MSFTLEFIRDYFNDIEDDKLNYLINYSFKNKFYLSLLTFDFTFLNKKYGYEAGDFLKEEFEKFLKKSMDSNIIYYTITSSKIFFYSKKKFDSSFKKGINNLHNKLKLKGFDLNGKEVIYFVDKSKFDHKYFIVDNTILSVLKLSKALFEEYNLNRRRKYVQGYFEEISKVKNVFQISIINKNYVNGFQEKDLPFQITEFNSQNFDYIYKNVKNLIKDSDYLNQAFELLNNRQRDWNYYIVQFNNLIAKYLIWVEMQKLLLDTTIIEKVNTHFYRENFNDTDFQTGKLKVPENEKIIRFDTKEGLMAWFDSIVRTIEHTYLSENEKKIINSIRSEIKILNLNNENQKLEFVKLVQDLFDNVQIKGLYNIPLEKVRPSKNSDKVFVNQLYVNFGSNYKNKYSIWRKSNFIKKGFYTFVKLPKLMNQTFDFFELKKENLNLNFAFLEIDGFNAFNNYYFPNDTDSIMYSKILNKIYEILNEFLMSSRKLKQEFFSKLIISVMGDEFFFLIPMNRKLMKKEKIWFQNYLEKIKLSILEFAQNIKFYETEKFNTISNNGQVTFRRMLVKKKHFYQKDLMLPIATLGVSGIIRYDINYVESEFSNRIKQLDNEMKLIKNNPKEKGIINIGK